MAESFMKTFEVAASWPDATWFGEPVEQVARRRWTASWPKGFDWRP